MQHISSNYCESVKFTSNMEIDLKNQHRLLEDKTENKDLYPDVKRALKEVAEKEGYRDYKIYKRTISTEGGNYLGVLYEVNIEGDTANGGKETNLFVKHVIPDYENVKLLSVSEVYIKETFVYRELGNIFTKLQNEADVPQGDRFKMVRSYDESTNDAIILENMAKKGFKTYSKMDVMSFDYAKLCIQQLAKFHGLSFVIERRMPKYFETRIKTLKQAISDENSLPQLAERMYKKISNKLTSDARSKLDKYLNKLFKTYSNYIQGNMTSTKCLCHGDYKMNNVLFQEIEGEVKEVIPVDFQLIYYGSPVIDFIYFLFIATDREFRRDHMNKLKDIYHDSLKAFLEYFDISVDVIYPRKMFEVDFENCLEYGLANSITILPFMFTLEEETPDLGKVDLTGLNFIIDDSYYERVQEIIDDFVEWGYL